MPLLGRSRLSRPAALPGGGDAEPTYNPGAGHTLLLSDGFESYTSGANITSGLWTHQENASIVTGRAGGASKAARITYPAFAGQVNAVLILEDVLGAPQRLCVEFWFRVPAGVYFPGDGIKWFEVWRTSGPRWTMGIGTQSGTDGPPGFRQTNHEFNVHDNYWQSNAPDYWPFCQNVSKAVKYTTVNDGNWHRFLYHIWLAPGKGVEEWCDGVKLLSTFDGAPGVPAGGMACDNNTVAILKFGDIMVSPPTAEPYWIEYDDVRIWAL